MLLKDSSYAVYENAQASKKYAPYLTCKVVDTGVQFFPVAFAYAMPKNSPFYAAFHYHISQLKAIGTVQRAVEAYESESQVCPNYSGMPLSISQCFTAFLFLLIGVGISTLWLG